MVFQKPGEEPATGLLHPPEERTGGAAAIAAYRTGRLRAQSMRIQTSMDRRRYGGPPEYCEANYEVLER